MRRILLVRHAECDANLHGVLKVTGQSPENLLTSLGQQQARALGKHFARVTVGQQLAGSQSQAQPPLLLPVFTSTAVRAVETAKLALAEMQPSEEQIVQSSELLEISLGNWEGRHRAACYTDDVMAEILRDPVNFAPPGGESLRDVEERMTRYIRRDVLPKVERGGPPALVVSHGLAIKCFLRGLLNADASMMRKTLLDNTSITEVGWSDVGSMQGWNILRVNDRSHLFLEGLC